MEILRIIVCLDIIILVVFMCKTDEPWHDKTNRMSVHTAKTQISLGVHPVWSEYSLSAWRNLGSLAIHWAHSKDWSDWADAQADLSLCWAHTHSVGFVMSWLRFFLTDTKYKFRRILVLAATVLINWDATWQNQQSGCAPNKDSDQPGHPPSLIRVFAVRLMGS